MLTMFEDDDSVFTAMRAGARGNVLKGADQVVIERAIHAVAGGESLFSAAIAKRLITYFKQPPAGNPAQPFPELTERDHEILGLVAQGLTNAEIARRLVISAKTVRNHVSNVFGKLQVADRAHAIARARQAGLGK